MEEREKMKQIMRKYFPNADELEIEGAMSEIGEIIDKVMEEMHDDWIEQEYYC